MKIDSRKGSIILQVAIFFLIGIIATGVLSYASFSILAENSVKSQMTSFSGQVAADAAASIREYPAYNELINYWYSHADEMDIEYDALSGPETATAGKTAQFYALCPKSDIDYVTGQDFVNMPDEAKKLYAEITYSRILTRLNKIKAVFMPDFLFFVITGASCDDQFFLMSAADPGAVRGKNYEEAYVLGVTVSVNNSQRDSMTAATAGSSEIAEAGHYVDCYYKFGELGDKYILIGTTFNLKDLRTDIEIQSFNRTINAILFQIVLAVLCLTLIAVFVLHPLKRVQKRIRLYKEDKDSEAVRRDLSAHNPPNEIGQLSEDIVKLTAEIDSYLNEIRNITAENERIGTELSLATAIQTGMLPNTFPPFPDRTEFDIYASMDPAKEVGGDFYDFFLIDDDHLAMVIADVSGKGVPAALFMMASKILINDRTLMGGTPAEILEFVNKQICKNNEAEMFVTVWLGIFEISTGKLTAANAGHEYPIINISGRYELLKNKHGMAVGAISEAKYKNYEITLKKGDSIFVYTDGVAEANNAEGTLFGTQRTVDVLNKDPGALPKETLKNVRTAVDEFVDGAPQFDDLTMMCFRYFG